VWRFWVVSKVIALMFGAVRVVADIEVEEVLR